MKLFLLFPFLVFSFSCTQNSITKVSVEQSDQIKETSQAQLLFFLNPNGTPCQMQDAILKSVEGKINGKVLIRRVSTSNPQDRSYFYQYGIRALPLLVLVDSQGNILKRFAPGIKNEKKILSTILDCKC